MFTETEAKEKYKIFSERFIRKDSEYTQYVRNINDSCKFSFDLYNTCGDCLAEK